MPSFDILMNKLQAYNQANALPDEQYWENEPNALGNQDNLKEAAVLLLLFQEPVLNEVHITLMKRTHHPSDPHSGQMSFPGGRLDPEDNGDLWQCALRETEEEIGISQKDISYIMPLPKVHVHVSDFIVQPFVASFCNGHPFFHPSIDEVDRIVTFPIASLLDPRLQGTMTKSISNGRKIKLPYFNLGYEKIWGATGNMLVQFSSILQVVVT